MGLRIAIVGEPTKGKSTSIFPNSLTSPPIKGLNPTETIILSFSGKIAPTKGANTMYPKGENIKDKAIRFIYVKDVKVLGTYINYINKERPEIKNIVLED